MFGLFKKKYNYRIHLKSGQTLVVKNCKDLMLEWSKSTGELTEYELTWHHVEDVTIRYINPAFIVAVEKF